LIFLFFKYTLISPDYFSLSLSHQMHNTQQQQQGKIKFDQTKKIKEKKNS
jgi:hypothetical protein